MAAGDVSVRFPKVYRVTPNDGTVSGGVTISDGAMVFDGVNGVVTTINSSNLPKTEITISSWVKFDADGALNVFVDDYGAVGNRGIAILKRATNQIRIISHNSTDTLLELDSTQTISGSSEFYHIVYTYKSGDSRMYINGVLEKNSSTLTGTLKTTNLNLQLGGRVGGLARFTGDMTTTQIFSKALSPSEISQIYNAGKDAYSPVTDGLVAQYSGRDFAGTEATPTKIYDVRYFGSRGEKTFIDTAFSEMRVNANSKFLMVPGHRGQVYVTHIEEAP